MMNQSRWKQLSQSGDKRGMAVLVSVLVISVIVLTISLSIGAISIGQNQANMHFSRSQQLLTNAEGCADEAIMRLNIDNNYAGGALTVSETSCTITVSGNGSNRTIDIAATEMNYTKDIQITISLDPTFTIDSWQELTN